MFPSAAASGNGLGAGHRASRKWRSPHGRRENTTIWQSTAGANVTNGRSLLLCIATVALAPSLDAWGLSWPQAPQHLPRVVRSTHLRAFPKPLYFFHSQRQSTSCQMPFQAMLRLGVTHLTIWQSNAPKRLNLSMHNTLKILGAILHSIRGTATPIRKLY